jgi:hypothetical protein
MTELLLSRYHTYVPSPAPAGEGQDGGSFCLVFFPPAHVRRHRGPRTSNSSSIYLIATSSR